MNRASRREFLRRAGVTAGLTGYSFAHAKSAPAPPNVILVLTDDQGYGDLSCHGNPVLKTPAMDRLHGESVRFTDFHSAPMCSPTRGQLMSGMDAAHNHVTATDTGRSLLRSELPTMANVFAASGYATGMFGKWHLGDNYPYRPMDRGFQEARYHLGGGMMSVSDYDNDYFNGRYQDNGVAKHFSGYCTDFWFDEAMKWMRQCSKQRNPFFCYLPSNAPHSPLWVAEKYAAPYREPGLPADYFGMIANLDENLAKLESFLAAGGLRENTILIFMTDNGTASGARVFNAGMRGTKTQFYDGGHRVPCFVRWPAGGLNRPADIDTPAQVQDVLPTLIDLCGLKKPGNAKFDGQSLAGLLKGSRDARLADRMMVVQYGVHLEKWDASVIWGKWRLIKGTELYDFQADAGEEKNLASQHPEIVGKMREHYERWWAGVEPTLSEVCPITIGSTKENPAVLSCADWEECGCRNSSVPTLVRKGQGAPQGGPWNVLVERGGEYEIALRRWPNFVMEVPLNASYPEKKLTVATLEAGTALPIAAAKLTVGEQQFATKTKAADSAAVFRVKLTTGQKTKIQGWFQDSSGKDLCGAYYAQVRRL